MSNRLHIQELASDLDVMETLRRFEDEPFLLLLDSAAHIRERDARYSFLTADPIDVVRLDKVSPGDHPFARLRQWQALLPEVTSETPPFCGGIAGMCSYELGHAF